MIAKKQDWDMVKQYFSVFWEGTPVNTCFFAVTAPKPSSPDSKLALKKPLRSEDRWLDKDLILNNMNCGKNCWN